MQYVSMIFSAWPESAPLGGLRSAFASSEVDKAALELAALELGLSTQPFWRIILSESGITTVSSNFSTSKLVEL